MIQIFVKVDGKLKAFMLNVAPNDKISDIVKRIPNSAYCSKRDKYVTLDRQMHRRSVELESCRISDGRALQVMSRMCGGGKHKDKKSNA